MASIFLATLKLVLKAAEVIDHQETGRAARHERIACGFTIRALASRIGISHATLSLWESGATHWNEERVNAFNSALQTPCS